MPPPLPAFTITITTSHLLVPLVRYLKGGAKRKQNLGLNEKGVGGPHLSVKRWRWPGRSVAAEMRHEEKRPRAKWAVRRSSRQPGALPCEMRLSEQQRRSRRSCECVNVWRELGSSEAEVQWERRAESEDRAGVKRAFCASNREGGGPGHCCPPQMFPGVVEKQLLDCVSLVLETCPSVFSSSGELSRSPHLLSAPLPWMLLLALWSSSCCH